MTTDFINFWNKPSPTDYLSFYLILIAVVQIHTAVLRVQHVGNRSLIGVCLCVIVQNIFVQSINLNCVILKPLNANRIITYLKIKRM